MATEATSCSIENSEGLAQEQSLKISQDWENFYRALPGNYGNCGMAEIIDGTIWTPDNDRNVKVENTTADARDPNAKSQQRMVLGLRHGERVDLTYGVWVPYCFNEKGEYKRQDLNMPPTLPERIGGADSYAKDTPLTRVGRLQAYLVGEGLRLEGVPIHHVYASPALRCIETAQGLLDGLQADRNLKIKVEQGLFECTRLHTLKGPMGPFMTLQELQKAGHNVDMDYKSLIDLDKSYCENEQEAYERLDTTMKHIVEVTEKDGGNIIFVAHGNIVVQLPASFSEINPEKAKEIYFKGALCTIPYCALSAVSGKPWKLIPPPCPPSLNSSSGRFDWKSVDFLRLYKKA